MRQARSVSQWVTKYCASLSLPNLRVPPCTTDQNFSTLPSCAQAMRTMLQAGMLQLTTTRSGLLGRTRLNTTHEIQLPAQCATRCTGSGRACCSGCEVAVLAHLDDQSHVGPCDPCQHTALTHQYLAEDIGPIKPAARFAVVSQILACSKRRDTMFETGDFLSFKGISGRNVPTGPR